MNPIAALEKLITEHGSAAILKQQLEFVREQFTAMERSLEESRSKAAKLEAKLDIEREKYSQIKGEFDNLKSEHEEEVLIYKLVEFRRGKRTRGAWVPFCPKCHSPVTCDFDSKAHAFCTSSCGWEAIIENNLPVLARQLESPNQVGHR